MSHNIDPAEIDKFEQLAHRWWDPNSEFKPLHAINPLRFDYIQQRVNLTGLRVLDVGCGGGILTESLAKAGAEVVGIDMGETPLNVARLHQLESKLNIDYQQTTAEQLAKQQPNRFDVVTCLEMLEHVPAPDSVVKACAELTRPGGHLFFSTINRTPKAYLFAIIGAEYILKLLPKGTHDYRKLIRPSELGQWLQNANLELKHITGMHYNPLSQRYWLAPGVGVNYLLHARKPNAA